MILWALKDAKSASIDSEGRSEGLAFVTVGMEF